MKKKENDMKIVICPKCLELEWLDWILHEVEFNGSNGMCYCEFCYFDKDVGDVVHPRIYNQYVDFDVKFFQKLKWGQQKKILNQLQKDVKTFLSKKEFDRVLIINRLMDKLILFIVVENGG